MGYHLTRRSARLALVLLVASSLVAAFSQGPARAADDLETAWDGPTLNLDWGGNNYATTTQSFVGSVVAVPGDQAWRTLKIRNASACDGHVELDIVDALASYPPQTLNSIVPEIIWLRWTVAGHSDRVTFADIIAAGRTYRLDTFDLAKDDAAAITIGYEFPFDETRGRNLAMPSTALTFDLRVTIGGDGVCPDSTPDPGSSTVPVSPSPTLTQSPGQTPTGSPQTSPSGSPNAGTASPTPPVPSASDSVSLRPRPDSSQEKPHQVSSPTQTVTISPTAAPGPRRTGLAQTGAAIVGVTALAAGLIVFGLALRRRRRASLGR